MNESSAEVSERRMSLVNSSSQSERLMNLFAWTQLKIDSGIQIVKEVGNRLELKFLKENNGVGKQVDNVKLLNKFSARNTAVGTLYLTATHLIFVDNAGKKEIWILHMHIFDIEKQPITTGGSPLQLHCKNFMCITFVIPKERDCHDVFMSLQELSKPDIESLYAFSYQQISDFPKSFGWDLFDTQTEFMRMGVPNEHWTMSTINKVYDICDTYPRYIFIPTIATTPVLVGSSQFRSRGRLPVLSYFHMKNQAAICRCSQPLAGFSARCLEDEQMLHAILKANPDSKFMYVVDTRPKINAMANKAAGKGYENEAFYSDMKFQFCGIDNIHVMRTSLQKLVDVSELKALSVSSFLTGLEASGWLKHIQAILETSVFIAKAVLEGTSVLVHCSDGWDRTAQTCSLSSLMLDPYYRTIEGFMALIEKEWISFGHKFMDRCGFLSSVDSKEISPVFTQFLESVWQMMQQFPCAFQFNERFLLTLHDHVYSCQFGTFIGNCEKDRVDLQVTERTFSLWGYLSFHKSEYLNSLFKKEYEVMQSVLIPKTHPQCIKYWKGMYNRFESSIHPRDQIQDILAAVKEHSSSLEDHVRLLEKRLTQICQVLGKSDDIIHQALQGCSSMESLDGAFTEDAAHNRLKNSFTEVTPQNKLNNNLIDLESEVDIQSSDCDSKRNHQPDLDHKNDIQNTVDSKRDILNRSKLIEGNISQAKSDSESGFDESFSQMSRSGIEECTALDTDLLSCSVSREKLNIDQLHLELFSVAVNWKSFRNVYTCSCAIPFDHYTQKFHCWRCGDVFCSCCIARNIPLPGHNSQHPVPVCKQCYKLIQHLPSVKFRSFTNQTTS